MDEPRPELRASDADRERVVGQLRQHTAEGRLTMDELDERLVATYAARTHGDLAAVTADLPTTAQPVFEAPTSTASTVPARRRSGRVAPVSRQMLASYLSVNLAVFAVWLVLAITGAGAEPWFLWVAGPWGAVLAGREIRHRLD